MAARGREKEPPDLVHQNQIFCETVRKELRCQKLHTEYGVNPLKRVDRGGGGASLLSWGETGLGDHGQLTQTGEKGYGQLEVVGQPTWPV
uniref:Uncharacterized protein n=1 Tax=Terrapene triunguis TaxID=2587831 RepID=A0A674JF40_9SAUR